MKLDRNFLFLIIFTGLIVFSSVGTIGKFLSENNFGFKSQDDSGSSSPFDDDNDDDNEDDQISDHNEADDHSDDHIEHDDDD